MMDLLESTWLTDEEYNNTKGVLDEHMRIKAILLDLAKRYRKAAESSEIKKNPFKVALREIDKDIV